MVVEGVVPGADGAPIAGGDPFIALGKVCVPLVGGDTAGAGVLPNFDDDDDDDAGGVGLFGGSGVAAEVDGGLGTDLLAAPGAGVGPGGGVAVAGEGLADVLLSDNGAALDGGIWAGADCACGGVTAG